MNGPKSFYYKMRKERVESGIQRNTAFNFSFTPDKKS